MHVAERVQALLGLDVMEDTVAVRDLELSRRLEVAHGPELQPGVGVRPSRDVEALARRVDADDHPRVELFEKLGAGAAGAAPVVEDAGGLHAEVAQAAASHRTRSWAKYSLDSPDSESPWFSALS